MSNTSTLTANSTSSAKERVSLRLHDGIAILTIDNPPVNAGSHAVRAGLVQGLDAAVRAEARGAVILGAGRCFVAGSDLKEFGQPLQKPELPDVISAIETAPFPVVAALHGVALGGGLELALGCDYRIAARGTKLGLPEVSLGMVPGAGGTQRLPRLVGISRAIPLICDGRRISEAEALKIGLVDAVASHDLLEDALRFLRESPRAKRTAASISPMRESTEALDLVAQEALKKGKHRPNVAEAIRLIRRAAEPDLLATLADERAVFQKLRLEEDAVALRYLFFAERQAGSVDGLDLGLARKITKVGVVGGGTMGQGIVRTFLAAGMTVELVERDKVALLSAIDAIASNLDAAVSKGRLSKDSREIQISNLSGSTNTDELSGCDLVIEAVFEEMDVKKSVLSDLDAALGADAIIATNTSYLDIDHMCEGLQHADRVLGLHFFSPADIMKLLEIVRAKATSDVTLATGLKLARTLGKQPVVARVAEGFVGNRIYAAYRRRAELLVLDGASPAEVDAAAVEFGFAMGPFAVSDMSGLDIAWAMRKRQAVTRDPQARYVEIPDRLCEAGRFGRKSNKGWYDYSGSAPAPSEEVSAIIAECRKSAEVSPQAFDPKEIQRQLLAAIVNEAALLLEEGVAQRASDVDVVLTNGYGFPRWRGGPLYWAAKQDRALLLADQDTLATAIGHGHRRGPVADILDALELLRKG